MVAVGVQDLDPFLLTSMLSFDSCVKDWEKHRSLRKRARSRSVLLVDSKGRSHVSPTLSNMKLNASLLRPFTRRMAECGRIRKPVNLIKEVCRTFYDSEAASDDEKKDTTDAKLRKERNINKSAEIIKTMLTAIKRKWSLWEIPRDEELRAMVFDLAEAVSKAYSELRRCALAKSPKARQDTGDEESSDDMFDDESLRSSLRSASRDLALSTPSPAEACLKAPPQAELEKLLGFSLDPESYKNLLKAKKEVTKPSHEPSELYVAEWDGEKPEKPDENLASGVDAPIHSQILQDSTELEDGHANSPVKPLALSPGSPEFISYKAAPPRYACENAKRQLHFDGCSEASTASGSKGPVCSSRTDNVETQAWAPSPEDYVNSWLEQQRLEHTARVEEARAAKEKEEHDAAAQGLEDRLRRSEQIARAASAEVVTRRDQLGLTAAKKSKEDSTELKDSKAGDGADEEAEKPAKGKSAAKSKAKAKATPKSKAKAAAAPSKATGKRKASAEWDGGVWDEEAWDETWNGDWENDWGNDGHWEKPSKAKPTTGKFSRSNSKGRFKKLKAMKKIKKSGSSELPDNATEYYGEGSSRAVTGPEASAALEAPSRRVRSKGAKPEEPAEPEDHGPEAGAGDGDDEEEVPTFARRYCGKRPYYKAKFFAIRDAYNDRIRVFLTNHSKMEDAFWRYVAQEIKTSPVEDADAWPEVVRAMTYGFLSDDSVSKTWTSEGEDFFVQCPSKKKYEAKLRKYAADAAH
ncbi:unnamed protein product [Symbiodinium sp. CCMP2592]|nr:unnamed protein product [Symbiodinium sp. CCMP2592]